MAKDKHGDATTTIQTRKDPKDGFTRTALVIDGKGGGSIDVLDRDGKRLCQLNISHLPKTADGEDWFNVDVIDVDGRFAKRRALSFAPNARTEMAVPEGGNLVAAEFTRKAK